MKRITPIFVLMILPILLIMLSVFYRASRGDFFLSWQYDPSYVYLINSLNLAQLSGYGTGFVDHPGITVQIVGALVIKVFHTFQGENPNVVIDVFSRPEFYLWRINLIFNIMIGIALFVLGFLTYKKLGIYAALILQSTPFYFSVTYLALSDVNSEIVLIFTILLFIAVSISFVNQKSLSTKNSLKYAIVYGLICGFGFATKLTFISVLLIPLILIRGFSFKVIFVFVTLTAFLIIVSPAISTDNMNHFINWVRNLTTRTGTYGTGAENYVDPSIYFENLKLIFTSELIFSLSYILMIIFLILQFFPKFKNSIRANKYYRLLIGIFIAITVQVILVGKHFSYRYMITAFILSIFGLFIINSMLSNIFPKYFERRKLAYVALILFCFSCVQLDLIVKELKFNIQKRNESYKFINYLEKNYKQSFIINSYGSSSKEFGLFLGIFFSGHNKYAYYSVLNNLFPNYFHYNKFSEDFNPDEIASLNAKLIDRNKIIFQCDNKEMINNFMRHLKEGMNKPNATYKMIYSNIWGETIYEISLEPS